MPAGHTHTRRPRRLAPAVLALGAAAALPAAHAGVTFDVIGPHEYELPVGFEPFNVFVQYGFVQQNDRVYDAGGDRVSGDGSQQIVGQSKYVRFWTPESNPDVGLAWEVIVPEIAVRNREAAEGERRRSGIGDPLTGFATWIKPADGLVLGLQSFASVPVGASEVSDTNWKNLTSVFWDWRGEALGWTGDAGFVWQGERDDGTRPGLTWHTNNRFGWRASRHLEPFLALDYEHTRASDDYDSSWVVDGGAGLMLHTFENQSLTFRYSTSLDGRNHVVADSWNLKYAYAW
ncbi:transporter [Coralloluteibacterium stylophorae]|uniref:Transporter n=1 Tax=Coralloluteibacterium stylophorae TaxID=1776034 RepID=A0A8J7VWU8_9GAMM|nr:transporter [Coralloluteibacterium stylophorae]MBS7458887.1 transporter [Coralloluteibacterium stylophorae]